MLKPSIKFKLGLLHFGKVGGALRFINMDEQARKEISVQIFRQKRINFLTPPTSLISSRSVKKL